MQNIPDGKLRQKIGGLKANAFGHMFEQLFLLHCRRLKIAVTQIPDSCKQIAQNRMIRIKSPFDWIITHQGRSAMIDTKTTEKNSFSRSEIVEHQVKELLMHEKSGGLAGYIIWHRKIDQISFLAASLLDATLQKRHSDTPLNREHPQIINLGTSHQFDLVKLFQK